MRRPLVLLGMVVAIATLPSACFPDRREVGVDVFSTDTIPATFTVTLTGNLVVGLRSANFHARPDKTLVLETPGSLVVQRGQGVATISAVDSAHRIAVAPIGTSIDSTDIAGVVGSVVTFERVGEEKRLRLLVRRP